MGLLLFGAGLLIGALSAVVLMSLLYASHRKVPDIEKDDLAKYADDRPSVLDPQLKTRLRKGGARE